MLGLGDKEHNRIVEAKKKADVEVEVHRNSALEYLARVLEKCEQQEEQIHDQMPVVYPTNARLKVKEKNMNNLQDLK